LVYTSLALTTR